MSANTLNSIADLARQTLADALWRQWAAIGAPAATERPAQAVVDPEALLLASLRASTWERRLSDVLGAWSEHWARLFGVQRVKNLLAYYPDTVRPGLSDFARFAWKEASDARWKGLASDNGLRTPRKRLHKPPALTNDAALLLRLRLAFGVNMRSDLMALLIATGASSHTVQSASKALDYTKAATRRALEDLATAGLVQTSENTRPTTYTVEKTNWVELWDLNNNGPRWVDWRESFGLLLAVDEWEERATSHDVSDTALEALGGELWSRYRRGGYDSLLDQRPHRSNPSFVEQIDGLCHAISKVV